MGGKPRVRQAADCLLGQHVMHSLRHALGGEGGEGRDIAQNARACELSDRSCTADAFEVWAIFRSNQWSTTGR